MGWFVVLLLMPTINLSAQKADTVHIYGQLMGTQAKFPWKVGLSQYRIPKSVSQTLVVSQYGAINKELPLSEPLFLALTFTEGDFNFIVTPAAKDYHIGIFFDEKGLSNIGVDASPENEAYRLFANTANPFIKKLMLYLTGAGPKDSVAFSTYWRANNEAMRAIGERYKGTFTSEVLAYALYHNSMQDTSKAYFNAHLLKPEIWNNRAFFNMPLAADLMSVYTTCFIDTERKQAFAAYDNLFKTITDSVARVRAQDLIFQLYLFKESEVKLGAYCDWVAQHPQLVTNGTLKTQLNRYGKILPGKPVPDIADTALDRSKRSLTTVAKAHKKTLFVIWSPNCEHCRDEVPQLLNLYNKYHPQGLEIFSSAIDCSIEDWRKFSLEKGLNWVNTFHGNPPGVNPLDAYMVTYTPTYIVLNGSGNVISRFARFPQLEEFLDKK
jgi:thiol-disulfide isomerase/thioredoxin